MKTDLAAFYGPEFYRTANRGSEGSARICVPLIVQLLQPSGVVDVGCGQGEWLKVFAEFGVSDYQGIDGKHISDEQLLIPSERFTRHDLTRPFGLGRRFDVAMSLEVAEHLPARAAAAFVRSLVALAPAVVFSAAVPGQGGVHHINEQWPWYWKELFGREGYIQLDPFRQALWKQQEVAVYYQHNMFLYVDPAVHKDLMDHIGVPERRQELTLVRTTILQELTKSSWVARFFYWFRRRVGQFGS
jgi:SAM-dependent methyltransferase